MANTARIKDLSAVTSAGSSDVLAIDGSNGTKGITYSNLSAQILDTLTSKTYSLDQGTKALPDAINDLYAGSPRASAASHNSIYRGDNLGTSFTSAMSSAIQAGTFDDLYVGDYLTLNGTVYRIAGFDLIKGVGDTNTTVHNMCLIPDANMYTAQMQNTDSGAYESGSDKNTTAGGYVGSEMRTTNLAQATQTILNDFGSAHVLTYRDYLTTTVTSGQASAGAWNDCRVELLSEIMVCGSPVWGCNGFEVGTLGFQFPLFRLNPEMIHRRTGFWLRSVRSATHFSLVHSYGYIFNNYATTAMGVRPFFFVN